MKPLNLIIAALAICGLIGVRMLEDQIFYDPFLNFFREDTKDTLFPDFDWWKLVGSHFLRFFLNLVFSAVFVQAVFGKKSWTLQAVLLSTLLFVITFPLYLYCLSTRFDMGTLFPFYVRRFVIQPLVLLLIVPIFYYRNLQLKKIEKNS